MAIDALVPRRPAPAWQELGHGVASSWQAHGKCTSSAWQVGHGKCVASAWQEDLPCRMASAWQDLPCICHAFALRSSRVCHAFAPGIPRIAPPARISYGNFVHLWNWIVELLSKLNETELVVLWFCVFAHPEFAWQKCMANAWHMHGGPGD